MNLSRRLVKLEGEVRPVPAPVTYDLRLLHPAAVDYICQFRFRPPDDQELLDNIPAIEDLLRQCQVEQIEGGPVILPKFPHDLQVYWQHQRFVNEGIGLPRGNYDFRTLTYAEQAQLQDLCEQYGWDRSTQEVEIEQLSCWAEPDLLKLYDLLEDAVPDSELAIR
jgi:hypothetical protein